MLSIALSMGVMVSCGDDEEIANSGNGTENNNNTGDNNGDHTGGSNEVTGLKAFTFGGEYFTGYNSNGEYDFNILYNNGNIVGLEAYGLVLRAEGSGFAVRNENASIVISGIRTNADGYITTFNEVDESPDESNRITYNFTYSGKNLTKIDYQIVWEEDGETGIENETFTLTWTNGNLTNVKQVGLDKHSNGEIIEEWTNEYKISYGAEKNTFKQYTFLLADIMDMEGFPLPLLGVLGEGPSLLPNTVSTVSTYYDGNLSHKCDISYTLNPSGTIASETRKIYRENWDESWNETYSCQFRYSGSSAQRISRVVSTNLKPFMQKTLRHHKHGRK